MLSRGLLSFIDRNGRFHPLYPCFPYCFSQRWAGFPGIDIACPDVRDKVEEMTPASGQRFVIADIGANRVERIESGPL